MDAKALTPEERAALRAALDEAEKPDPVEQMGGELKAVCERMGALEESFAKLKALVIDDLVGGIKEAYDGNVRTERMGEFKGKYGSMLDPMAEKFSKTYTNTKTGTPADIHEQAFNWWDQESRKDDFDGEAWDKSFSETIADIKEKLGLNDPAPAEKPVVEEVKPAEPAPAPEGEAEEEPEEDAQMAWDEIAQMKKRDDAKASSREKNKPARKGA